jgi:transposase
VAVEGHDHKDGSMKLHGSAALSQRQRRRLVELVASGTTIAAAAALVGCSRQTGSKWVGRARRGEGLEDRSSRPHRQPRRTPAGVEREVLRARRELRLGPHPLGWALGLAASTVHAILSRNGCSRLRERPDRGEIVRYERERPGELVHVDVKKLGRIVKPSHRVRHCGGARHRFRGRSTRSTRRDAPNSQSSAWTLNDFCSPIYLAETWRGVR